MVTAETRLAALARVGKALADRTRCRILLRLLDHPCYPAEMAEHLGLTRANVSNHLTCLRGCGIVVEDLAGVVLAVDEAQPCLDRPTEPAEITERTGAGR
jgi:DNA-binding transcriptional ArsR family regulator